MSNTILLQVETSNELGIDFDGPLPYDQRDTSTVNVDPPEIPFSPQDYCDLCDQISPLEPSLDYGMDICTRTVHFVCDVIS